MIVRRTFAVSEHVLLDDAAQLFRGGRVVDEFVGAQPLARVRAFVEPHLPRASDAEHQAARELATSGDYAAAVEKRFVEAEFSALKATERVSAEDIRKMVEELGDIAHAADMAALIAGRREVVAADKEGCCQRLLRLALERGAPDNVTAVIAQL